MSSKKWVYSFVVIYSCVLIIVAIMVVYIDPFIHYHKPLEQFSYRYFSTRHQNDGITKWFDYDAIITGTSMTENFKTSELDKLFHVKSIKVPYAGATYREISDNLKVALKTHPDLKYVVRCLDYEKLLDDPEKRREDLGEYPVYLYDNKLYNDVKYIYNKDVLFDYCGPILREYFKDTQVQTISFDEYMRWADDENYIYGKEAVIGERHKYSEAEFEKDLTEQEKVNLCMNIEQNVLEVVKNSPNTTFLLFFSPYSVAYWGGLYEKGTIDKQLEAEMIAIEMLLEHDNIKLFSFNHVEEITANLDNYKDELHYGEWINSFILESMSKEEYLITKDNYLEYLQKEEQLYRMYDYNSLCQ